MSDSLWVASRKGLFELRETDAGWAIERVSFLGHPVTIVLPDARDGSLYAGLNLGHFGVKLHRSEDRGVTWTEVAVPAYPPVEEGKDAKGSSLFLLWGLEAAGPNTSDGLWAGTIPGGLFHSADRGATWTMNEPLWKIRQQPGAEWFGGGYDQPGIHSICVDPRDKQHILVGVSCGGVWRTTDGGATWSGATKGMAATYMPPERAEEPAVQDPHRMVRCLSQPDALWVQHHCGIFRTVDNAQTWSTVTGVAPSDFGFAVAVHPHDPQTAWFVPGVKDECRVPVDAKLVVTQTRDGGKTCHSLTNGLPSVPSYDLVYRHALDIDATGNRLAFGSTTGNLWTTTDGGATWTPFAAHLPPIAAVRFG